MMITQRKLSNKILRDFTAFFCLAIVFGCGPIYNGSADGIDGDLDSEFELTGDEDYPPEPFGYGVGDTMANFLLLDCDGNPVQLSDYYGDIKTILINQSAGWCSVCNRETPTLEEWYQELKDDGVLVLQALFQNNAFQPANSAFCKAWRDRYGVSYPVLVDDQNIFKPYHPSVQGGSVQYGTPLNVILDADMKIQYLLEGDMPPEMKDILIQTANQ